MNLAIQTYGLLLGLCAFVAFGSGIWLLMRPRDVAQIVETPDNEVVPGRARGSPASKTVVRTVLAVNILATLAAIGIFALIASGVIDSSDTETDPQAQRP
jgi:hypothetical protein